MRFPRSPSIMVLTGVTRAVEYGFMAAGVTVAAIAAVRAIAIVLSWLAAI